MTHEDEDRNFSTALENVLAGRKIPPGLSEEDQAILALTTDLARTEFSVAYGKRAALLHRLLEQPGRKAADARGEWLPIRDRYTRISQPMKTTIRTRVSRVFALSFAMVAVIATVLFFSPATRAFADSIFWQFGGYIFVQAPPQPQTDDKDIVGQGELVSPERAATLQKEKEQERKELQENNNEITTSPVAPDATVASQMAGFDVLSPAYVPDGYTAVKKNEIPAGWSINHENGGVDVRINYYNQATQDFIVIEEAKYDQGQPTTVDRPQITDVTVRGQPGAWMPDNGGKSTLAWDENGITYLVVGNVLSLDEALKVAESLGK